MSNKVLWLLVLLVAGWLLLTPEGRRIVWRFAGRIREEGTGGAPAQ